MNAIVVEGLVKVYESRAGPVSVLPAGIRDLWGNPNPFVGNGFPARNPVLMSLAWTVVFIIVFGRIAVRKYRWLNR